jgi:HK97 family phage prohead protease
MDLIHKTIDFQVRQVGNPEDRTLEFIGSTADVDRYGDVIEVAGWDLKNYKKNPVVLWAHDYQQPPIGKTVAVSKTDQGLTFQVKFPRPDEYPFADTIYKLYLGGYLCATSVGFRDLKREPILGKPDPASGGYQPQTGWRYLEQELYELSCVPVPANPNAVMMAVQKGIVTQTEADLVSKVAEVEGEAKGVIPFKKFPTDDPGAAWDGPAEIKAADVAALKIICAWFDEAAPEVKGSYKLPHHRAESKNVVWAGVAAAMGALLGARGGVNVPDGDRKGIYNHLVKEYALFSKTPPEFKAYGEADLVRITLGAEPNGLGFDDLMLSGLIRVPEIEPETDPVTINVKAGAVLSAKNKEKLTKAMGSMMEAHGHCKDILDSCTPMDEPSKSHKSYIFTALNPGITPPGERQAEESDKLGESINKLKQTINPPTAE